MKIAQVSPLYESVPPKMYGGTERVVSYLTDELVRQGHEVTLFASGDSKTKASLVKVCDTALRLSQCHDPLAHHIIQLQEVMDRINEFDIVHFHNDYLHFPLSKNCGLPNITTLHGRLDLPDLIPLYRIFKDMPLVSISNSQRQPIPHAFWLGTVYHGLPHDLYRQGDGQGDYVAFLGRISPEKRVDRAIEIAAKAGVKIKIAAKIDQADQAYYKEKIKHLLDQPHVTYIGEIGENEKGELLGNAMALLFPIDWPEPFGMVMIESMACGTPVIACNCGSVPEVIEHGKTGYIVSSMEEAVHSLREIEKIDRSTCRSIFEKNFSAERMAKDYLALYRKAIDLKNTIGSLDYSSLHIASCLQQEKSLNPVMN